MKIKSLIFIFISVLMSLSSCGGEEQGLSPEQKNVLDSLYGVESGALRIYTDSLCKMNKDTLFKRAADSIQKIRMKEIEQLLMK